MNLPAGSPAEFTTIIRQLPTGPMEVRANMAACERILRERLSWRVWAVTTFQAPDADGLAMDAERELIAAAEAELFMIVPASGSTIYAGGIAHECRYVAVLYSNLPDALGPPPVSRVSGTRYTWNVYTEEDPEAEFLRAKLMLTPDELRILKDREVLDALAGEGDNPVVPRPITFYGLFASFDYAERAAALLQQKGFRTSAPSEMPGNPKFPYSLMFQRTANTEPASIHPLSAQAESVCLNNGGSYDGWTCEPVGS